MNVPYREIELLRTPGGLQEMLDSPDDHRLTLKSLVQVSQLTGKKMVWTQENLKAALAKITPDQLSHSKGKDVSEFEVIVGDSYRDGLGGLGKSVGIEFDFSVLFRWFPVDSQRTLLYSAQFGAQEAFADAMARRHFTLGKASGDRETVLEAATEVGLDPRKVEAMLNGSEFEQEVWNSYTDTTGKHRINSIPFFTFNGPLTNGGKFREEGVNAGELNVRGSGNVDQFLEVFERIKMEQL